jgi:uncharacterized membrane protein
MKMVSKLIQANKLKPALLILMIGTFGILLVFFRIFKTGSPHFIFLIWNLMLAGIPWILSTLLILYPKIRKRIIVLIFIGILWILFIPNAFYILTDLFHLNYQNRAPVWYDLILIFSFAWAGILLGFSSLKDIEQVLSERINGKFIPFILSGLLFLSAFGIYLGRFLRWNSWNIINRPGELLFDIKERFENPMDHPGTWGMTILTGIMLNLIWWSFRMFNHKEKIEVQ